MKIKCLIFDADNTLYHTKQAAKLGYEALFKFIHQRTQIPIDKLEQTYQEIVSKVKLETKPAKRKHDYSVQKLLQKFFKDSPTLLAESMEVFWETVAKNIIPAPSVRNLIQEFSKNYIVVVASDEFQKPLITKLKAVLGNLEVFRMIVTPEVTSSMKPSRLYYDKIIEELKLKPEECLMIGDSWKRDLEPALEIGLRTVLVNEKKDGKPNYWIKRLDELPLILKLIK